MILQQLAQKTEALLRRAMLFQHGLEHVVENGEQRRGLFVAKLAFFTESVVYVVEVQTQLLYLVRVVARNHGRGQIEYLCQHLALLTISRRLL